MDKEFRQVRVLATQEQDCPWKGAKHKLQCCRIKEKLWLLRPKKKDFLCFLLSDNVAHDLEAKKLRNSDGTNWFVLENMLVLLEDLLYNIQALVNTKHQLSNFSDLTLKLRVSAHVASVQGNIEKYNRNQFSLH